MKMSYEELQGLLNIFGLSLEIEGNYAYLYDMDSGEKLEAYRSYYRDKIDRAVDLFDGKGFYVMGQLTYTSKEYFIEIKAKSDYFYVKSIREQINNECIIDRGKSIVDYTKLDFEKLNSDDSIFKCTEKYMELRDGYKLDNYSKIEYEVREPYKYDGSIRIEENDCFCSMFFHKNQHGEEQEPIYGNYSGLFEKEALDMIENSYHFKDLLDYISPRLAECYEEKNVKKQIMKKNDK